MNVGGDNGDKTVAEPTQITPKNAKEMRNKVCMDIGRCFFENALPFHLAKSLSFINMCRSIGNYGRGLKSPSMYELRTWILKEEIKTTDAIVEDVKKTWPQTGVSIMSDGWSDIRNRNAKRLFKMLGDVIEEIGEHLVIQVVIDNASAFKAAELPQHKNASLKAKKLSKFIHNHQWALSLMRKFSKRDILRLAATRFATAFLTLQSINQVKQPLEAMFTSEEWTSCAWVSKPEGKEARKIVLKDKHFRPSVVYAIKTTKPLVEVLRLVDADKEPAMGYLYNAMDSAKEKIAQNLGGEEKDYKEIWEIIDEKWELQLHRHLHVAAYFLNPRCHYAPGFSNHPEIKLGLFHCMDKLIPNPEDREKADLQCSTFHNKEGVDLGTSCRIGPGGLGRIGAEWSGPGEMLAEGKLGLVELGGQLAWAKGVIRLEELRLGNAEESLGQLAASGVLGAEGMLRDGQGGELEEGSSTGLMLAGWADCNA
ncbi:uncharacterized protein LOC133796311 [Humulus lupulus]|uniref:uncharacterized protein LOC133796311 n=1 Tax=Humulus lupulus TaxID=3486 RepID=UPI002B405C07|nr:uncharacterized protein LOC133796311 [Humulus lupulus]